MYHVSIDDIVRLNPGSDKQIRAGEALKIPQTNSSSSNKSGRFHTIQAGETLYQLTVKYNVSAQAICDANPGLSASNFRVGQVVSIPTEDVTEPATPLAPTQPSTLWYYARRFTGSESGIEKRKTEKGHVHLYSLP